MENTYNNLKKGAVMAATGLSMLVMSSCNQYTDNSHEYEIMRGDTMTSICDNQVKAPKSDRADCIDAIFDMNVPTRCIYDGGKLRDNCKIYVPKFKK